MGRPPAGSRRARAYGESTSAYAENCSSVVPPAKVATDSAAASAAGSANRKAGSQDRSRSSVRASGMLDAAAAAAAAENEQITQDIEEGTRRHPAAAEPRTNRQKGVSFP